MEKKYNKIILHLTSGEVIETAFGEDECDRLFNHFKGINIWTSGAYIVNNIIVPFMNIAYIERR